MAVRYADDDVEEQEYLPGYLAQFADDQPDEIPVFDQDAEDAAAYFRGFMTEHRRQLDLLDASGHTSCDACGHLRKVHSRIGCVEQGCTCAVTYMDL